jgi:hypothetical protein
MAEPTPIDAETLERYRSALQSIAGNSCCTPCREAGFVAQAALRCDGRYPVPGPRDEPFPVTYRCGLTAGHDGPCGLGASPALPRTGEPEETLEHQLREEVRWLRANESTNNYSGRLASLIEEAADEIAALTRARAEAEHTVASIAMMLGWGNIPPRDTLERDINTLKARAREAQAQTLAAVRQIVMQDFYRVGDPRSASLIAKLDALAIGSPTPGAQTEEGTQT